MVCHSIRDQYQLINFYPCTCFETTIELYQLNFTFRTGLDKLFRVSGSRRIAARGAYMIGSEQGVCTGFTHVGVDGLVGGGGRLLDSLDGAVRLAVLPRDVARNRISGGLVATAPRLVAVAAPTRSVLMAAPKCLFLIASATRLFADVFFFVISRKCIVFSETSSSSLRIDLTRRAALLRLLLRLRL